MTQQSITNFQFKLTGVPNNIDVFRTKQSVKKRIADILYLGTPTQDSVKLEYIGSLESTPSSTIFIADRSDEIYANSRNNTIQEIIGDRDSTRIPVANKNFIITQEFIDNTTVPIPLYYKTLLPTDTLPESIHILDQNFQEVPTDKYKIVQNILYDDDTGSPYTDSTESNGGYYVFNSLQNIYDNATGEFDVYFIQYTRSSGGVDTVVTNILDNQYAYDEADFTDFWYQTPGFLKPWARVYTYTSSEDIYIISLPPSGINRYAIKYLEEDRISIKKPIDFSDVGPWFPRISNGQFFLAKNNYSSKYEIAEFNNQAFNPIAPYKLAGRARCTKISDTLIKLPHTNIIESDEFSFAPIDVYLEEDNLIKYAITSDTDKVGSAVTGLDGNIVSDEDGELLLWRNDLFLGKDSLSGIVYLNLNIKDVYDIYASYNYEEKDYTLSSLILNPIFDSSLTSSIRVVYIVPKNIKNGNRDSQEASIKWITVSSSGNILFSNQDGTDGNLQINSNTHITNSYGYSITGVIGLHYSWYKSCSVSASFTIGSGNIINVDSTSGFPQSGWLRATDDDGYFRYFKYISKTDTTFTISSESTDVPTLGTLTCSSDIDIILVNFVDEYTIQSRREFSTEAVYYNDVSGPSILSQYFVLGELSINPSNGIHDLARIDIRENGGGIIESKYNEAKNINPEVQWFNDFGSFDGQLYPGKSTAIVKLPIALKDNFTLEQIESKVYECIPMGVKPLIRFYGYEPRITSVIPDTDSIEIQWEREGAEFVYDIWYAKANSTNPIYIKANKGPLFDGSGNVNNFTITGLTTGVKYIVKITMHDRYFQWWYGYDGPNSVSGGYGINENAPSPPFGNFSNFQFNVNS